MVPYPSGTIQASGRRKIKKKKKHFTLFKTQTFILTFKQIVCTHTAFSAAAGQD